MENRKAKRKPSKTNPNGRSIQCLENRGDIRTQFYLLKMLSQEDLVERKCLHTGHGAWEINIPPPPPPKKRKTNYVALARKGLKTVTLSQLKCL